jgi:3-hydroxy-9,10-secoandrosta-1,3,5(10)-triene-9,17-dione monooxygenase
MQIDHEEIMRRADTIAPMLAEHARECDAARKLTAESMAAVVNAGMFRIPQPRRVGGYELSLRTLADAVTRLSEACPSSGWVLMVMGAHHWTKYSATDATAWSRGRCHGKAPRARSMAAGASRGDGSSAAASTMRTG